MRKSRFTEAQVIGMFKEQEAGMPTAEVCRRHGLSPATFYKLKSKYGGMEVSEASRLKALEGENAKLTKLLAEQMMDITTLNEMSGNKCQARLTQKRDDLRNQREGIQSEACECLG